MSYKINRAFWYIFLVHRYNSYLLVTDMYPNRTLVHVKSGYEKIFLIFLDLTTSIGKDPDAGRDWGQEEKGMTEDEMAGRHHRLDGHEFGWTPEVGDGQRGLVYCDSWGCKELDTTE
ncbi:unnamed protein product [Rangifer tarandus platyrhynchus]|uniref:Uncharacterized protein n=2 Tax=Rangifer tarandus platyrhynchus TaxID=3082113 RepID=A0ABN8ZZ46_RANTA|nr:unnamed protein product [Rangifer tarandus platyrhynchus]